MNLKRGTPGYGVVIGLVFVVCGVLLLTICFWKPVLLAALFGAGYFFGTVEDKGEFLREKANQLIPQKESKVIDLRSELEKEQEEQMARTEASKSGTTDNASQSE